MSRTLFENSKAALGFAAIIIVGAVSMVGTSDNGGMLPKIADRFGKKPDYAQAPSAPVPASERETAPPPEPKQVEDWYAPPPTTVFGDYKPDEPGSQGSAQPATSGFAPTTTPSASPQQKPGFNPMTAPLSPTAVVQ
ncbi:MAG: hypothetical protein ACKO01_00750 [Erythrobacter sp.]